MDLILDLPLQDQQRVESTPGFKVGQVPQLTWMQLEMDGTRDVALDVYDKSGKALNTNPFKDVRVRQAIAHAVDANLIAQRVMRDKARIVGIPSVPGLAGHQDSMDVRWPTDLVKAKALLGEAGYPNGFITQLNCPLERYVNTDEICRAVASMLARIGIEVRVKGMVWPEFARMLVNGPTTSFHLIGAGPNSWDGQDTFTSIMMTRNSAAKQGGFNWALWTNADVDRIGNELKSTFDKGKRDKLYAEGFAIAKDKVHAVYLHQAMLTWGMKATVEAAVRADGTPMLQDVTVR
jgi:peptide/nickel transport system substrate-binding protein